MTLKELLAKLGEGQTALVVLQTKATGADATEADIAALDTKIGEIEKIEAKIETLKKVDAALARKAVPVTEPAGQTVLPSGQKIAPQIKEVKPIEKLALMASAIVKSGPGALKTLEDEGYGQVASEFGAVQKNQNTLTGAAGGFLVPTPLQNEIIELLRPATTFLQANPRRVPLPNGRIEIPAGATGATASYVGEGARKPVTGITFRKVDLNAKKLAGIVRMTKEVKTFSLPDIQGFIQSDLQSAMGEAMDTAAWIGSGAGSVPLGISNIVGIGSDAAVTGVAPTYQQIEADLTKMELRLYTGHVRNMAAQVWWMAPRTFFYLRDLRDGNGNRIYPELNSATPRLRDRPVLMSTICPVNLGAGTNESLIVLADFSHVLYGDAEGMTLKVSEEATITPDGGVTWISAYQDNLIFILAEMMHDFDIRVAASVTKLTAVRWGG